MLLVGRPKRSERGSQPTRLDARCAIHSARPWNQDQKATGTRARDRTRRSRPTGHRCIASQPPTPCRLPDEVQAGSCRSNWHWGGRCAMGHQPSGSQVGRLVTARRICATQDGCSCPGSSAVDPCCCARWRSPWRSGVGVLGPGDGPAIQMCRASSPTGHAAVLMSAARRGHGPLVWGALLFWGAWSAAGLMSRCLVLFRSAGLASRGGWSRA
jgi:hypothetical protein